MHYYTNFTYLGLNEQENKMAEIPTKLFVIMLDQKLEQIITRQKITPS